MRKSLLLIVLLSVSGIVRSQLIKNGSFEFFTGSTCITPGAGCTPCYACSTGTVMPSWHVDAGNADIMKISTNNSNLSAGVPDGSYGVDLNGTLPATISQQLSNLVPNTPYLLSFWYSNNDIQTQYCSMDKPMQVTVYDENDDIVVRNIYRTDTMTPKLTARFNRWAKVFLPFTPESNFVKIEFKSLFGISGPVAGCGFNPLNATDPNIIYGPTLDDIVLSGIDALPLHLLSFDGTYNTDALQLKWKTADEENLVKILVQYDNGNAWEDIGSLPATGNRGSNDYAISIPVVKIKNVANVALRLKMLHMDNKITYSHVIYLQSRAKKRISIYPNPVINNSLNIYGLAVGETIRVYNASGQLLKTRIAGNSFEKIDLGANAKGLMNLTVTDKTGKVEMIKFMKSN